MPKIGLRNIKTAIAVTICLMLNVILIAIFGSDFARDWYTPFFAGIAAVYSMQADKASSFRQARIRSVGSIIGGYFGMIILLLYEWLLLPWASDLGGDALSKMVLYLFVGIGIVLVIYITVVLKQTSATFITCLTFLSVTVSIRNGGLPAPIFATNRIMSTLIGVFVSLLVNVFRMPHYKNKDLLFVCGLDKTLLNDKNEITGFTKYRLNYLLSQGANITIATTRSAASLNGILAGINFNLPLIIMSGAALYDIKNHKYLSVININSDTCDRLEEIFEKEDMNYFAHTIIDDVLHIYYQKLDNEGEKKFYHDRKNENFKNYVRGRVPDGEAIAFYILIGETEKILKIKNTINESGIDDVTLACYEHPKFKGYNFLKIRSSSAKKFNTLHNSNAFDDKFIVAIGSSKFDCAIMEQSDYSVTTGRADDEAKEIANYSIKSKSCDSVVKYIQKMFHKRNISK